MTGWPGGLLGRVRGQRTGREPFAPPPPLSLELRLARIERELAAARRALEHQAAAIEALTELLVARLDLVAGGAPLAPQAAAVGGRKARGLGKGLGALIPSEPENIARRPAPAGFALPVAASASASTALLVRAKGPHPLAQATAPLHSAPATGTRARPL